MKLNYNLMSKYEVNNPPLEEYPRPQMVRDSYLNLNGKWNFAISKFNSIEQEFKEEILVPYPVESSLSGICIRIPNKYYLIYNKKFNIEKGFLHEYTILHFDAVDQVCDIYFNKKKVMHHEGGYLPFSCHVLAKEGINEIDVVVDDSNSYNYPTGKQREKRGGIWYTKVSGIWQSVWLESVSYDYIKSFKISSDLDSGEVSFDFDTQATSVEVFVYEDEKLLCSDKGLMNIKIKIDNPKYWSPENPFLYKVVFRTNYDTVKSYFAFRKFSIKDNKFYLNNKPYFVNGLLDQGYFSDGIYTPASYEAFKDDILTMKELGFNTLRKHIKIEPMMFYYYCDTLGMLVFQDMVNLGKYSFFKDTALAFLGKKKAPYKSLSVEQKNTFTKHSKETVNYLFNVPSVVYYTIFNEGWGQFDADKMYDILKNVDSTRIYDATSGWYRETKSDVASYHIYFKPLKIKEETKPIIISEFGGYSYKDLDHSFNLSKTFGYKKFDSKEEFNEAFINLYKNEVIPLKDKLAGIIYTQVSDVEDETNGLLTYDRKVLKVNKEVVKPLMEELTKDN